MGGCRKPELRSLESARSAGGAQEVEDVPNRVRYDESNVVRDISRCFDGFDSNKTGSERVEVEF